MPTGLAETEEGRLECLRIMRVGYGYNVKNVGDG